QCHPHHRDLPSFPTRRSSDLHTLDLTGRDRTGALVDCSAVVDRYEFANVGVRRLVEQVAAPFGIPVSVQAGLGDAQTPVSKLTRSEEHTSELQSRENLVCRLL